MIYITSSSNIEVQELQQGKPPKQERLPSYLGSYHAPLLAPILPSLQLSAMVRLPKVNVAYYILDPLEAKSCAKNIENTKPTFPCDSNCFHVAGNVILSLLKEASRFSWLDIRVHFHACTHMPVSGGRCPMLV